MVPYVLQLVAIGTIWVSFHCIGMCGPIVAGLNASDTQTGDESWFARGTLNVLAYQSGRGITYATLGAVAGWIGQSIDYLIAGTGHVVALVAGLGLLVSGGARLVGADLSFSAARPGTVGGRLGRVGRRLLRFAETRGRLRFALFGAVMGFLPCMLMFWTLGLAASSGGPLAGAGIMLGLVAMTTPALILAGNAPLAGGEFADRYGDRVAGAALAISGIWLGLIGAASSGWIAHASVELETQFGPLTLMFW